MKIIIIILSIFFCVGILFHLFDRLNFNSITAQNRTGSQECINFSTDVELNASEVLHGFVNSKFKKNFYISDFSAIYRDLDNDGIDEIIGIMTPSILTSNKHYSFFLLKKINNKYDFAAPILTYSNKNSLKISYEKNYSILEFDRPYEDYKTKKYTDYHYIYKYDGEFSELPQYSFISEYFENNKQILAGEIVNIDFYKNSNLNAEKQLEKFVLSKENKDSKNILQKDAKFYATYYDLNNDGIDEILGIVNSTFLGGNIAYRFYVLQKNNDKYVELYPNIIVYPTPIKIIKSGNLTFVELLVKSEVIDIFTSVDTFNVYQYSEKYTYYDSKIRKSVKTTPMI